MRGKWIKSEKEECLFKLPFEMQIVKNFKNRTKIQGPSCGFQRNQTSMAMLVGDRFLIEKFFRLQYRMKKEQGRLTVQYNDAIIKLIRNKFQPLQRSKFSLHNSQKQRTTENYKETKSSHLHPQVSFPSLPSAPAHVLTEKSESQYSLLQKARSYIQGKRPGKPSQVQHSQLREYIELFERRIEMKERGKRESIQLNLMDFDTRQKLQPLAAIRIDHEQLELNQQQRSIMNAKIRRKLNHKKIIDLAKRS